MTREEAWQGLEGYALFIADGTDLKEALSMAIEALQTPPITQRSMYQAGYRQGQEETLKQITGKLNNPTNSLFTADSEICKEQKSKLDLISRAEAIEAITETLDAIDHVPKWVFDKLTSAIEILPPADRSRGEQSRLRSRDENNERSRIMARNVFYTDEEKRILANLIEDMAELSNMDLARIAHRYGLFPNRTEKGLSLQIGKMKMTPQSADDENNSEDEQLDIEKEILRAENARLKEQYEGLLNAVVGQADIYTNLNAPSLKLNLAAIRKWVYGNVPERVNARIEELMAE